MTPIPVETDKIELQPAALTAEALRMHDHDPSEGQRISRLQHEDRRYLDMPWQPVPRLRADQVDRLNNVLYLYGRRTSYYISSSEEPSAPRSLERSWNGLSVDRRDLVDEDMMIDIPFLWRHPNHYPKTVSSSVELSAGPKSSVIHPDSHSNDVQNSDFEDHFEVSNVSAAGTEGARGHDRDRDLIDVGGQFDPKDAQLGRSFVLSDETEA